MRVLILVLVSWMFVGCGGEGAKDSQDPVCLRSCDGVQSACHQECDDVFAAETAVCTESAAVCVDACRAEYDVCIGDCQVGTLASCSSTCEDSRLNCVQVGCGISLVEVTPCQRLAAEKANDICPIACNDDRKTCGETCD